MTPIYSLFGRRESGTMPLERAASSRLVNLRPYFFSIVAVKSSTLSAASSFTNFSFFSLTLTSTPASSSSCSFFRFSLAFFLFCFLSSLIFFCDFAPLNRVGIEKIVCGKNREIGSYFVSLFFLICYYFENKQKTY